MVVDLSRNNEAIKSIWPLGYKNWSRYALDASDRDNTAGTGAAVNMQRYNNLVRRAPTDAYGERALPSARPKSLRDGLRGSAMLRKGHPYSAGRALACSHAATSSWPARGHLCVWVWGSTVTNVGIVCVAQHPAIVTSLPPSFL